MAIISDNSFWTEEDENRIVICKQCHGPEYYGKMVWLSGKCLCRDCYKSEYQREYHKPYKWNDLAGHRPTWDEYKAWEAKNGKYC